MEFEAELKQTKQYKAASLDNLYSILFVTDNPMVMDLGKLPPQTTFQVTVAIAGSSSDNKVKLKGKAQWQEKK